MIVDSVVVGIIMLATALLGFAIGANTQKMRSKFEQEEE